MKRIKITKDDRPGNMMSVYENIETHERAKIVKYEDKYKTLVMMNSTNKGVSITYGTFKRLWKEISNEDV